MANWDWHKSLVLAFYLMTSGCSLLTTRSYQEEPDAEPVIPPTLSDKGFMPEWPVDQARLTRGFQRGRHPHDGLDLAAKRGTPIYASHDGLVIYTGKDFRGYGKMVLIEFDKEWATLYAHLDRIVINQGQKVKRGDLLGKMGATGRTTGVHLHFEVRKNRVAIDPLGILPRIR